MATKAFDNANKNKADEFYTQLYDIELELKHYMEYFKEILMEYNMGIIIK